MLHDPRRDFIIGSEPRLICGEAVAVMRAQIPSRSIDMIYSDPPFGNEQIWTGKAGSFSDRWKPDDASRDGWRALDDHNPLGARLMRVARPDSKGQAYLGVMAAILVEAHRVLQPTGTLWLHFDDTMGAYLRLLCDCVFGPQNSVGTLVWRRTESHNNTKSFGRVHDTIACYARSRAAFWRLWRIGTLGGDPLSKDWHPGFADFAEAKPLSSGDAERVKYPTQKPVALLEELIEWATLENDVVLDPTCGSGTTLVAAQKANCRVIGIDLSPDAVTTASARIARAPKAQLNLF